MDREKDREKVDAYAGVVKELEQVISDATYPDRPRGFMMPLEMAERVLAALKAQEPRVIRFDEINNYEVLWLEVRDVETEDGLAPWIKTASGRWFSPLFCSETRPDMILSTPREYGRICRCWTSRPTDKQRREAEWE